MRAARGTTPAAPCPQLPGRWPALPGPARLPTDLGAGPWTPLAAPGRLRFPNASRPGNGGIAAAARRYILSIIARPKPEHDTCFAPGINRAKS
jgi:hypothetical protein